jgi:hypothetical protein
MPKGARRRPGRLAEKLCHIRHRLELTQEELLIPAPRGSIRWKNV